MADINSFLCTPNNDIFYLDFNGNIINSGEYWVAFNDSDPYKTQRICVETTTNINSPGSGFLATTEYTSCYDCLSNNNGIVALQGCFGGEIPGLYIYVSGLTSTEYSEIYSIVTGQTFQPLYIEFLMSGNIQKGCYVPVQINTVSLQEVEQLSLQLQSQGQQIVNTLTYTAQTSCESCLTGSSFVYTVKNCLTEVNDYVYLPYNFPNGNLISYTDGINEFCGIVSEITQVNTTTYSFVTDYGPYQDIIGCEPCLQNANKKVRIQNCVNEFEQYVAWASQLYGLGESSNFERNNSCYQIIGETSLPVDSNIFLDYEPHNDCNSCLSCNGVNYRFALCTDPLNEIGVIFTNQILTNGYTFINPNDGSCCVILGTTTDIPNLYLYSTQPCECEGIINYRVWFAKICSLSNYFYVMTDISSQIGDIVKIMYGDVDYLCMELIEEVSPIYKEYYNTKRDGSGNTIKYNNCEDCINNTTIGVRTVNCDTQELTIVDLNHTDYIEVNNISRTDYFFIPCFVDTNGNCRTVVETCPQPPTGNLMTLSERYFSCPICRTFNPQPIPPRSANTESTVCVICCECGATGSTVTQVSPPHPVWTDGYGTPVTQLNMITIGGNGLNS